VIGSGDTDAELPVDQVQSTSDLGFILIAFRLVSRILVAGLRPLWALGSLWGFWLLRDGPDGHPGDKALAPLTSDEAPDLVDICLTDQDGPPLIQVIKLAVFESFDADPRVVSCKGSLHQAGLNIWFISVTVV